MAIDGTATAGQGRFHNYAASADGGYGGVTSFNNNKPYLKDPTQGATAGNGLFYNYGAQANGEGGGHTFFTGKFGTATAGQGTFVNYGAAVKGSGSSAGHTVLSISLPQEISYSPNAGNGTFWNFPGTAAGAPGGYTQLTVYTESGTPITGSKGPGGGTATFINLGAVVAGAGGGQTKFGGTANAEQASLIASGGLNGGLGGVIAFSEASSGGTASVFLGGNGVLDISQQDSPGLTIGTLDLAPGMITTTLGSNTTCLTVSDTVKISGGPVMFAFQAGAGFALGTAYTILTAPNLSNFSAQQFAGNGLGGGTPTFSIVGNNLQVTFTS